MSGVDGGAGEMARSIATNGAATDVVHKGTCQIKKDRAKRTEAVPTMEVTVPILKGTVPILKGTVPILKGTVPILKGTVPNPELDRVER